MRSTALIIATMLVVGPLAGDEPRSPAVAVICHLSGTVLATSASQDQRQAIALFTELEAGTSLKIKKRSTAVIAFFDGSRFQITGPAEVVVEQERLDVVRGSVEELEAIPALRDFSELRAPRAVPARPGSTGEESGRARDAILRVYPAQGAAATAEGTVLRFTPFEGAERYWLEVKNFRGRTVLEAETGRTELEIPAGVLLPRALYRWQVQVVQPEQIDASGRGSFMTVGREPAARRDQLATAAEATSDVSLFLLVAEMDHRLGLYQRACGSLSAASDLAEDDPSLAHARTAMSCGVDGYTDWARADAASGE